MIGRSALYKQMAEEHEFWTCKLNLYDLEGISFGHSFSMEQFSSDTCRRYVDLLSRNDVITA